MSGWEKARWRWPFVDSTQVWNVNLCGWLHQPRRGGGVGCCQDHGLFSCEAFVSTLLCYCLLPKNWEKCYNFVSLGNNCSKAVNVRTVYICNDFQNVNPEGSVVSGSLQRFAQSQISVMFLYEIILQTTLSFQNVGHATCNGSFQWMLFI